MPELNDGDQVIRVPLTSLSCLSTTQIAYLSVLGLANTISGVGHASSIKDSLIQKQLIDGWTVEITRSGQLDKERVLQSNTSILMANAFDKLSVSSLLELGIPVIYSTEYLESNALARAEWIKFFALFFNAEKKASSYFNQIEKEYHLAKSRISNIEERPSVMYGSYYQGSWYIPGGQSLITGLFKDAGARYVYEDQLTRTNIHVDTESLMNRMNEIDKWGFVLSKEGEILRSDFLADDPRMLELAENNNMKFFYCNSYYADYFGMANLEPQILLRDLGKVFHPELFPEHRFVYFQAFK